MNEIFDYVQADNPVAAHQWLNRFDQTLSRLSSCPRSGILPRDESLKRRGYRVVVVGDYLAFYVIKGFTVQIRRVIHGRRRYSFLL